MRQIFISLVILFSVGNIVSAQTFSNSAGLTLSFLQGRETKDGPYKNLIIQKSATYFPRLNLSEKENSSFSIGMPISLGIGSVNNSDGVFFNADAPLVADYNMGCRSTPDNGSGFGGFFGAGFGYNYTTYSGYFGSGNVSSYGPMAHAGIRFVVSQKFSEVMGFGVFYKLGLESEKYKTFGFNVLYEF